MSGVEIPVADFADAPDSVRFAGMIPISGGTFRMGSSQHYPEEAPVHRVTVGDFRIDRYPVTNRRFKEFVRATGHVTFAEIAPDPKDYPGALPHMLYAGSLVFTPIERPVDCATGASGGSSSRAPIGATLTDPIALSTGSTIIRSCISPIQTRSLMRAGPARICRRKPSGNSPRAVALMPVNLPGARSLRPAIGTWPTPGRASFRVKTSIRMVSNEPRR